MRRLALPLLLAGLLVLSGCHRTARPVPTTTSRPAPTTSRPTPGMTTTSRPAGKCASPASYLAKSKPSPCLTPGAVRTSDPKVICVAGYATRVRRELSSAQWAVRRVQVERAYGLERNPGEIDHLLPLEGGGANDLGNLWPESAPQYRSKDRAENALHAAICARGVTAAKARALQAAFLRQWGGTL